MLCAGMGLGRGVRQNDIVAFGRSALLERPLQSCGFSARALSARAANVILTDILRSARRSGAGVFGRVAAEFCWPSGWDSACAMARIKQNGILGQLLRDSWLAFTEGLL